MSKEPAIEAQYAPQPNMKSGSSGKAIASLVFGLLSFFCAFLTGIVAIILGVVAIGDISKSHGRLQGNGMAIAGIILGAVGCFWTLILVGMMLPAVQQVREAARRATVMNNVRQVGLAMHNYQSANMRFPPSRANNGLSWRVHILPFLGENELYDQFHLDEPWDSPHNLSLIAMMPDIYKNPNFELEPGMTVFQVPKTPASASQIGPSAAFVQGQDGPSIGMIADGLANTVLIFEVNPEAAATWTDPDGDWMYDPRDPWRGLGGVRAGLVVACMADGSSRSIGKRTSPEALNALITRNGGDAVGGR